MKKQCNYLNTSELRRITGAANWLVNYLVAEGKVPVIRLGRGVHRLFLPEAITVVEEYLSTQSKKRGKHGSTI